MGDAATFRAFCPSCGQGFTLGDKSDGICHVCRMIEADEKASQPKAKKAKGPWKPRKRSWPNGRPYWVVMAGNRILVSAKGSESRFSNKDIAQHWADKHNAEEPADA